jgi:hypothetical protein
MLPPGRAAIKPSESDQMQPSWQAMVPARRRPSADRADLTSDGPEKQPLPDLLLPAPHPADASKQRDIPSYLSGQHLDQKTSRPHAARRSGAPSFRPAVTMRDRLTVIGHSLSAASDRIPDGCPPWSSAGLVGCMMPLPWAWNVPWR